jgi:enamine deaminase RidA (YjgF/YER057c/UK114 family)
MRVSYSSGAPWEDKVGYRRAMRIGNVIEVSGTTAVRDGVVQGKGDIYHQSITCFEIIKESIESLGGKMDDVIRTRMYTTDIKQWELIGKAHHQFFKDIHPASTLIEVSAFVDDALLIEIEATAILDHG